jgi:purine-binding chemotaxis protein CheW
LPLDQLREVARVSHLRRVPGAPAGVAGLVNLRGEILCALDVREILGLPAQTSTDSPFLVALRGFGDPLGLIVDSIADIYAVLPSEIEPPPAIWPAERAACFIGTARVPVGLIGAARSRAGDEGMTVTIEAVSLLVFEAADCLMAVPASEIAHLEGVQTPFLRKSKSGGV